MRSVRLNAAARGLVVALLALGSALIVAPVTQTQAAAGCAVTYHLTNQWSNTPTNGGFQVDLSITNNGTTTFNGWSLTFAFANGQTIGQLWNAALTQTGANVTVASNQTWNATIAPGATLTGVGFTGTWSGTNAAPTTFSVNGVVCGGVGVATATATPMVAATGTPTQTATSTATRTSTAVVGATSTPTRTSTAVVGATSTPTRTATPPTPTATPTSTVMVTPTPTPTQVTGTNAFVQRFQAQYAKIKNASNGYFSPEGVPYHSVEKLIVEAPDYGHETTSETFSYWIWLEAMNGKVTGNWQPFADAWAKLEASIIPAPADQPTGGYNPASPATYAREHANPNLYPSALNAGVQAGQDPLVSEFVSTYGGSTSAPPPVYGMHWLLDVDNFYKYGNHSDGTSHVAYINTFQRGSQESVWETVTHPSWETLKWGRVNVGFLTLFIGAASDTSAAAQWRYTDAPDADARAIQAVYWAKVWADQQGGSPLVDNVVTKAAKMGDYLRYALFDKYFKTIGGCTSEAACQAGQGRSSEHYLLSWYYAFGGATNGAWSWRIGSSASHFGYQNPLTAWALSGTSPVSGLKPQSPLAATDWSKSLQRQIEFYRWLQSSEGGIAGGATNSWGGNYGSEDTIPPNDPTFYGMFYDFQPVYHDPPSNEWFGFQAWSMERVAEYYFQTTGNPGEAARNAMARTVLDKWVAWAMSQTTISATNFSIPSKMSWSGAPDTWNVAAPGANAGLHVTVVASGNDVGVAAAYAKTLMYYAASSSTSPANATAARDMAKGLLNVMWANFQDNLGVSLPETRTDYKRFNDPVFIPSGWTGTNAQGGALNSATTFSSMRPSYADPNVVPAADWAKVQAYLAGGPAPTFTYHRFWAQTDIALAMGEFGRLFPDVAP